MRSSSGESKCWYTPYTCIPDFANSWSAARIHLFTSEPTTWKVPLIPAPGKAVVALIRPLAGTAPSLVVGLLSKTTLVPETPLLPVVDLGDTAPDRGFT